MNKLVEFGEPHNAEWHQQTIGDISGELYALCEREIDRADRTGASLYGKGRIARRYDLVEKARELLEEAEKI